MFRSYILAFLMELWPKRVAALYNKYENMVQLVSSEIIILLIGKCPTYGGIHSKIW
jgi:hypothetical protein